MEKIKNALDYQDNYELKVEEAATFIKSKLGSKVPEFGLCLGSGLNELVDSINIIEEIEYKNIPNFPISTVKGHEGKLIIGTINNVLIIGLKGRKHYYEVASEPFNTGILQVVFPIHVLANLGVKNYFVTNAVGGLNINYNVGDLMIIDSHINFIKNPLLGRIHNFKKLNNEPLERFPSMANEYNPELIKILENASTDYKDNVHKGTYLGLEGPSFETKAECLLFRDGFNADVVGMSTTPEVIVARARGINIVGLSCVTNRIDKNGLNATNHEEVNSILNSKTTKERIKNIILNFFKIYNK